MTETDNPSRTDKPVVTHANAQSMIAALKVERAGYEQRGLKDRVKAVDEQLVHWVQVANNAPVSPDEAGEVRASDVQVNAEKMLTALREERAAFDGREGKADRVAAIDEQIKHWTGVVRKASGATEPVDANVRPGRQTRAA